MAQAILRLFANPKMTAVFCESVTNTSRKKLSVISFQD